MIGIDLIEDCSLSEESLAVEYLAEAYIKSGIFCILAIFKTVFE